MADYSYIMVLLENLLNFLLLYLVARYQFLYLDLVIKNQGNFLIRFFFSFNFKFYVPKTLKTIVFVRNFIRILADILKQQIQKKILLKLNLVNVRLISKQNSKFH